MVTSKNSTLKKFILIAFAMLLVLACLYFVTGCSLFGNSGNNSGTDPDPDTNPNPPPDVTETYTPERARFDPVTTTLYVSDCSAAGITYYRVEQRVVNYGNNNKRTVGELDTTDMQAENGLFAIRLKNLISTDSGFEITVWCLNKSTDRTGYSKKFNFVCGGKVEHYVELCSFDNDTGEFTWSAVTGATGYSVTVYGSDEAVTVNEPKFTVDESIYSFRVVPLFEEDNLYGGYTTINLYGHDVSGAVRYDEKRGAFSWDRRLDCDYTVRITDGDKVVEGAAQVVTDTGWGNAAYYYTPTADSVTVQVSSSSPISRPYTSDEKTFNVCNGPADIAIGKTSGDLTWNKIQDFGEYVVELELEDGTTKTMNTKSEKLSFASQYAITGAVTAKIRVNADNKSNILLYSEPFDFWILSPKAFSPKVNVDVDTEKLSVAIAADEKNVAGYDVTLTSQSGEQTKAVNCADAVDGTVSAELSLPLNEVADIRVERRYIGQDGRIYFRGNVSLDDFSKTLMAVDQPEVEVIDKNAQSGSALGFTAKISFPQALRGKGQLTVSYKYENSNISTVSGSYKMSDDYNKFFARPIYQNGLYSLTIYFSKFETNDGSTVELYRKVFKTTVKSLSSVKVSAADAAQIDWQSVSGADQYLVEKSDPDGNTQTIRTAETTCAHEISAEGNYVYYITPTSSNQFVMDGERFLCVVEKLVKPTVTIASDGTLTVESNKFNVTVVTSLDGNNVSLTPAAIRNAFGDKTETSLVAYNHGVNTSSRFYIDSEEATYTLHRIAEVNSDNLGLAVDVSANLVTWTASTHARDYSCRLFRREDQSAAFALENEFTLDTVEIDGAPLRWGYYRLEVKPLGYSVDNDLFIYLDDYAEGLFSKDGISSVAWDRALTFTMTDGCFVNYFNIAYRAVTIDDGNPLQYSNNPTMDLSRYIGVFPARTVGAHTLTVLPMYVHDYKLAETNTLKADAYILPFEVKQSETPDVKSGSYTFLNAQDNSAVDMASVEIVPVAQTLKSFEHYSVVYRTKDYNPNVTATTKVNETDGLTATATVSGDYINLFTLRVVSERFTIESDGLVYYITSGESTGKYSFAANEVYTAAVADVEVSNSAITVTLDINYDDYDDGDVVLVQCMSSTGAWTMVKDYSVKDLDSGQIKYTVNKSAIKLDRDLGIRIVHHRTKGKSGVTFDNSCFYYISVAWRQ